MKVHLRRITILSVAASAVAGLVLAQSVQMPLRLVYNASASVPRGFYLVLEPGPLRHGDLVLARLPRSWQARAIHRGYIGDDVHLVKWIAALEGDHVCTRGRQLLVNGRVTAVSLQRDGDGRVLLRWRGCRVLRPGEILLLAPGRRGSFDSRYFGPLSAGSVLGRLKRLLLRPHRGTAASAASHRGKTPGCSVCPLW